jgi:hypothetical protein
MSTALLSPSLVFRKFVLRVPNLKEFLCPGIAFKLGVLRGRGWRWQGGRRCAVSCGWLARARQARQPSPTSVSARIDWKSGCHATSRKVSVIGRKGRHGDPSIGRAGQIDRQPTGLGQMARRHLVPAMRTGHRRHVPAMPVARGR